MGEDRQDRAQRQPTAAVDLESALLRRAGRGAIQIEPQLVGADPLQFAQVRGPDPGREDLLVRGREAAPVGLGVEVAQPLAELLDHRRAEILVPVPGRLDDLALQILGIDLGDGPARGHVQDEVQGGQRRLGGPGGVVHRLGLEPLAQDARHLQPGGGVVPVPRQVDQAGHEPAERVLAQEELGPDLLAQLDDGHAVAGELLDTAPEELVARVVLQLTEQRLAAV
ncbi:hypothetical protein SDC9_96100 [bioreactor metagenome]|uniref:Uncharacterized protein n=1 Tax=bioreactor metagenome TaxID=1076179 RepID=A0A645AAP9_9ZZZZ